jgi:hypothetical protein
MLNILSCYFGHHSWQHQRNLGHMDSQGNLQKQGIMEQCQFCQATRTVLNHEPIPVRTNDSL